MNNNFLKRIKYILEGFIPETRINFEYLFLRRLFASFANDYNSCLLLFFINDPKYNLIFIKMMKPGRIYFIM